MSVSNGTTALHYRVTITLDDPSGSWEVAVDGIEQTTAWPVAEVDADPVLLDDIVRDFIMLAADLPDGVWHDLVLEFVDGTGAPITWMQPR